MRLTNSNFIKRHFTGIRMSILVFIIVFFYFIYMLKNISDDTLDRQEQSLITALNRCIVSCYSVEGTYPPSLAYIKEHYGLLYDEESFFVDYTPIGSNMYPDVTVIRKEEK